LSELLQKIAAGATVLTVNSRLSRHLLAQYEQWRLEQGCTHWPTPQITPWSAWVQRQWQELTFAQTELPTLLSNEQCLAVWESVIESSRWGEALLNTQATARAAMQAWRLLRQWQLQPAMLAHEEGTDTVAFYDWAQAFQKRCYKERWLDEAALPTRIAEALADGLLHIEGEFLWFGFDDITPQHQTLIEAQQQAGATVALAELPLKTAQPRLFSCADAATEIRSIAAWLRHLLDSGAVGPIGVVVPDLAALRHDIERIFDEALLPGAVLDLSQSHPKPYDISLGHNLATLPLIHAALNLLMLVRGAAPLHQWGRLLLSPFIAGGEQESLMRAQLDAALRRHGESSLTLKSLIYHAGRHHCPLLAQALQRLADSFSTAPRRQSPAAWSHTIEQLLQAMGWPGERTLDSHEYQTVQAWRKLLTKFAGLSQVLPELNYSDALKQLRQLANATLFQPQSATRPVQVMGVLEAVGLEFTHCWVMGLHDGVWPSAPQPNPFLPITLQRRLQMPHASAERELNFATQVSHRLFAAAPQVIISYPQHEGDSELRASPLISDIETLSPPSWLMQPPQRYRNQLFEQRALESYSDWQGPMLADDVPVSGGASIFKDQAACPFRAFARYRLFAESLEEPSSGLDAAERGSLVHKVLEVFWKNTDDLQTLNQLSDEALHQQVTEIVAVIIAAEARDYPQIFTERFANLERNRLIKLVCAWLDVERSRPPFSVAALEAEQRFAIGGVEVKMKADRIDRLQSGGEMIIDYKTGKTSINDWFGERPNEPQLPLYALAQGNTVEAITFASLRPERCAFQGVSKDENVAKGISQSKIDWQVQQGLWRDALTALAKEFRQGRAVVDPKEGDKTCQFCDLGPLCRIHELNGELNGLGVDEVESEDE
jgi:probable DNA repair protein